MITCGFALHVLISSHQPGSAQLTGMSISFTTPSSGENKQANLRMRTSHLPVVKPHDITPGYPSEDHIAGRCTTEQQPNDVFAPEFGFQPPPPLIGGHRGTAKTEQSSRDSFYKAR